eukprot:5374543-Pyramimonas_sp.AAC.1
MQISPVWPRRDGTMAQRGDLPTPQPATDQAASEKAPRGTRNTWARTASSSFKISIGKARNCAT